MDFVTLDQARAQIYGLPGDDDALLAGYLTAASAAVQGYLKSRAPWLQEVDSNNQPVVDSNGPVWVQDSTGKVVDPRVQQATLLLVAYFYRNRDENPNGEFALGMLPTYVTALLYPLRDPALA